MKRIGWPRFQGTVVKEVFNEDYVASDEDKVHSRNPTVDMHQYRFRINQTRIEISDVGGQRSELVG